MIRGAIRLFSRGVVKTAAVAAVSIGVYLAGREVGRYEINQKKGE